MFCLRLENTPISFDEGSKLHYYVHILHSCYSIESWSPNGTLIWNALTRREFQDLFSLFNYIAWETSWTEQKAQMFESNSYHKEWRSREGLWKISYASFFVPQITDLKKCNLMYNYRLRCLLQEMSICSNHNWNHNSLLMIRNKFSDGSRGGRTRPE